MKAKAAGPSTDLGEEWRVFQSAGRILVMEDPRTLETKRRYHLRLFWMFLGTFVALLAITVVYATWLYGDDVDGSTSVLHSLVGLIALVAFAAVSAFVSRHFDAWNGPIRVHLRGISYYDGEMIVFLPWDRIGHWRRGHHWYFGPVLRLGGIGTMGFELYLLRSMEDYAEAEAVVRDNVPAQGAHA